jgi:hypothetical protein
MVFTFYTLIHRYEDLMQNLKYAVSLCIALFMLLMCPIRALADTVLFTQGSGTVSAANDTVALSSLQGESACIIDVSGTWSGVITPEAIVGSTWFSIPVYPYGSATSVSTITVNGDYTTSCAALKSIRARLSTATSGTASIFISAAQGTAFHPAVPPVTSVTATSPLNSTGGTTPTVALTGTVPVANGGTGAASFTANTCTMPNTAVNAFQSTACDLFVTSTSFVVPALGTAVTITLNTSVGPKLQALKFTPMSWTDGTTALDGYVSVTNSTPSATVSFIPLQIVAGAVGNTVAAGANGNFGNYDSFQGSFKNGVMTPGISHYEWFNNATINSGSNHTYNFGQGYSSAPGCQASGSSTGAVLLAGTNNFSVVSSTTNVVVTNGTGATQTPTVTCQGI